jgi:glycolate oxidase FAD binding subunit
MTATDATRTLRPSTLAELHDALAGVEPLVIRGAGTAADWGGVPDTAGAVLDTTGLCGVIEYHPADMTVCVGAGTPLADVQGELACQGQRVALDAARIPVGATVGGLIATGDGGPLRHAYGTMRDLVIGVTVALADATIARSGGQVIKNVAGYDLGKLFHGSLGTLGVLAEVWLRAHPSPRDSATLAVPCSVADGFCLGGRLMTEALEPATLEWCAGRLLARFEGTADGVAAAAGAAESLAGEVSVLRGDDERAAWDMVAGVATGQAGDTVLRAGTLPADAGWLTGRVAALADQHGAEAATSSSLGVGVHTIRLRGGDHSSLLAALRGELDERGAATTVVRRDGLGPEVPAWGTAPAAVGLLRAAKARFDPTGRFGAGRFAPWF